ncbi:Transmembrane protein 8B [Bienertia sinuspersici]
MKQHSFLNWVSLNLCLILFLGYFHYSSADPLTPNSFTISSFNYPQTKLKPYDWLYIRVDLPPWFSSMSIVLESDVNLGSGSVEKIPKSRLPLICFRDGSPPLPDSSNKALKRLGSLSNGSIEAIEGVLNGEHCYPLEKRVTLKLTNEQGCIASNLGGQFCNQSIKALSCSQLYAGDSLPNLSAADLKDGARNHVISCKNSVEDACLGDNETRVYSLEITGMVERLTIAATVRLNKTSLLNNTDKAGKVALMCYVRYGAIALATMHDFSGDISQGSLIVPLPKMGRWYITIAHVNLTKGFDGVRESVTRICYSLAWQVAECPFGKAGFNCTSEIYSLQTILRKNPSVPFESYYLPLDGKVSSDSANFPLGPLLSNSTLGRNLGITWTYFVLDIPAGAGGGNLHFRLTSNERVGNEIYLRYGGLPTADIWDFYYVNHMNSSDGTMSFLLYNSSKAMVDFYVLYAREGTWGFGLKHLNTFDSASLEQTAVSISLERCPKKCSAPHGTCQNFVDESGLTLYSYCACDRTHGGTDCSIELISQRGHRWQSISLVASNVAAVLPAYWALRNKAFAEWVIFTSSGISSGLYHACDVGAWCALTFHVLQFMDFWLSFLAVVSTFVYLAAIDEASRRTIHAVVSILTALMAITGATRSLSFRGGFRLSELYSLWHVSIYTASFLFLCSKVIPRAADTENPRLQSGSYELTRVDSVSHGG